MVYTLRYLGILEVFTISVVALCFTNQLHAQSLPDERRVTTEFVEIPIDSALLILSAESGVGISYDSRIIPPDKKVTLSANHLMLGLALDNILVDTDISYGIVGNQIVLKIEEIVAPVRVATISGYLKDADSGEHLVYANASSIEPVYGTSSNEFGYYSLTLPVGVYEIQYSYVGYETHTVDLDLTEDIVIDAELSTSALLNEVVIFGEVPKESKYSEDFAEMPLEMLSSLPSLAGEPDIIRLAQSRAGVSSQVDGFGGLQVRGGSADQNLILLDGVPVYNTGHALGLFSIFNSSAIKSAKLIKGGFPARYGGRLSSVFDIRTKEGNKNEIKGDAAISPLMLRGTVEGPIKRGKSSFLLSARRTIIDPWLRPLSRYQFERNREDGQINFFFYDINAKFNAEIGNKHQVYVSLYGGQDKYANEVTGFLDTPAGEIEELDQTDVEWGNIIGTVRLTSNFNNKTFGNFSLSTTQFSFDYFDFVRTITRDNNIETSRGYNSRLFSSEIKDLIISYDVDWFINPSYYLKFGANYTKHSLTPGSDLSSTLDDLLNDDGLITVDDIKARSDFENFKGDEYRVFVENELRLSPTFSANLGAHFSAIKVGSGNFLSLQPRVSLRWQATPNVNFKLGFSETDQYFHLLSSAGLGLPSDVWLPSTELLEPEKSRQLSISMETKVLDDFVLRVSGYTKSLDNVTGFAQGASLDISGQVDWQADVPVGSGSTRGLEIELEKRVGTIRGWIAYTLSKSDRTFPTINEGRTFRASNDRRHLFHANVLASLNSNLEISAGWTYGSPLPTTVPASTDPIVVNGQFIWVPIIPAINNVDLPAYHKLDIGLNLYSKFDWGSQKVSFGVYNTYARRNPYFIDVVFDETGGAYNNEQISVLPFIPYVSLGISF